MNTALLLGNYRPTFVLAKSLKARGYRVISGLDGYDRGGEVSNFVDAVWDHPTYQKDLPVFQTALLDFLKAHPEITDVYPVAEPVIRAFADGRLQVPDTVRLGTMEAGLVTHCLDKRALLTQAHGLSVPVAPFAETEGQEHLYAKAEEIGFPLVIRPLETGLLLDHKKAITCTSLEEMKGLDAVWAGCGYQLLIQRHAAGKRDNIYFAARNGKIIRYLHAKITRTDQPDGSGLAVEGETVSPCPILKEHTEKLVADLAYDGIGCAQYLVDAKSGAISFLELNPRIAGNHALPEVCGLALSDCLIDKTEGSTTQSAYREGQTGIRYSWIAGELDAIKKAWKSGRLSFAQALKASFDAFRCFRRDEFDVGFAPGDRKPGLFTLCDSLPLIGGITRKRFQSPFFYNLFIGKECLK